CGHKPFHRRCLSCGFEKPVQVLEDSTQGVMKEIRIGKRGPVMDKRDVWMQLCAITHRHGFKSGFAYHKYVAITGEKPKWDFQALDIPITPAIERELQRQRIAYRKAAHT